MQVRLAKPADLDAVIAIDPMAHGESSRRTFLETAVRAGDCWLAERTGGPVGFVVLQHSFYGNGFVPLVLVNRSDRRQGIGRTLLEHAASICTTSKLFTSTNESNAAMRSLLSGLRFEPSGVIHNLDPSDPELIYVRRLRR